jgi:hypothetical protein
MQLEDQRTSSDNTKALAGELLPVMRGPLTFF